MCFGRGDPEAEATGRSSDVGQDHAPRCAQKKSSEACAEMSARRSTWCNRATATVGGEPGEFVRIDGRWYLESNMEIDEGSGGNESLPGKASR